MSLARFNVIHDQDPAKLIFAEVNSTLPNIDIALQSVLVAIYRRPSAKTESNLYLPETVVDEDRYQSKVGLVLKVGPTAFNDDPQLNVWFHDFRCKVGDWVLYKHSDGMKVVLGGWGGRECRLISDVFIKAKLTGPDVVF